MGNNYRHLINRYSTGQGPIVNIGVPENKTDYASYKMKPLQYRLGRPEFSVDLLREADRISMQVEASAQTIKVLGYNSKAGKDFRGLKSRLEVIKHLMINYPIRMVKNADLESLYVMYEKNSPGMDKLIKDVVNQNKDTKRSVPDFVGTSYSVRQGYPVFDDKGKVLSPPDMATFKKGEKASSKTLAGVDLGSNKLLILALAGVGLYMFINR
jgi:hypothetical protein